MGTHKLFEGTGEKRAVPRNGLGQGTEADQS